jgi:ADP-ribosylglycohydrolase
MTIPTDYLERVYSGILGKIIGVYLGRPFEGWTHDRILSELGPIRYYVNERLGKPLVVTDDDISGTLTFVRALSDFGNTAGLTATQIGHWLNYIIENRTILWRLRQLDGTHRLSSSQARSAGASKWFDRAEWKNGGRTDWRANLY